MLVIELTHERTGVTLAIDLVSIDCDVHLGQFAFRTADILFNELIQHLPEIFLSELSVDDVVGIVLSSSLLESSLGGLFEAKPFKDVLLIGSQMLGHIAQVHYIRLDSVALALDLQLHLGHLVTELGVNDSRWYVQHW